MAGQAARPVRQSDERLITLFLDMLAAERGAGVNTLDAYGRDLADVAADLARAKGSIARAGTDDLRAYLSRLARRGMRASTVARRLSAVRQLYRFLSCPRPAQGRPGRGARRPEAQPPVAEDFKHSRGRRAAASGGGMRPGGAAARAAAGGAAHLPAGDAVRHRPAGLGIGSTAGFGRPPRCARHRGARQGQQGAHGSAQRGRQERDDNVPRAARRSGT